MKKFTGFIAAAAIAITPMSSSALEALTDNAMNSVTGQAGVSIAIDDVVIYQESMADVTYFDTDGVTESSIFDLSGGEQAQMDLDLNGDGIDDVFGQDMFEDAYGNPTPGMPDYGDDPSTAGVTETDFFLGTFTTTGLSPYLMPNALSTNTSTNIDHSTDDLGETGVKIAYDDTSKKITTLNAIINDEVYNEALFNSVYAGAGDLSMSNRKAAALSIDIGTCEVLTAGNQYNAELSISKYEDTFSNAATLAVPTLKAVAGVVIGLPTLEIKSYSANERKIISIVNDDAINADDEFIAIEKNGTSTLAILGGTIEIAPH